MNFGFGRVFKAKAGLASPPGGRAVVNGAAKKRLRPVGLPSLTLFSCGLPAALRGSQGALPLSPRKPNRRDRGSLRCARTTRIDLACPLPSPVSATAKGSGRGLNPASNREKTMKEQRFDIHQHITNQIVAAIEAGAGDFRLPWHRSAGSIMRPR